MKKHSALKESGLFTKEQANIRIGKKSTFNRFLILPIFLMAMLWSGLGWGQQVIGSFPYMNGGFEGQATGALGTTVSSTLWTRQSQAGASSSIVTASPRTGSQYASVTNVATVSRGLQSPQLTPFVAGSTTLASTNYVVQFFTKNAATVASFQGAVTTNGTTNPAYSTAATLAINATWTKQTLLLTTTAFAVTSSGIAIIGRSAAGAFNVDDVVIYAGSAVDVTAANSPGSVTVNNPSTSSLDVSWGAASGGVDGGGYVVVRYSTSPNADNDPNQNGIYAVGNTTTNGTGSLVGTIVYVGTALSFTNTGLSSGTQYWYKVYTVDKAFNYSAESSGNATTTSSGTPTLTATPNSLTGFTYVLGGGPSGVQNFALTGTSLNGTNVTLTPSTNYEISISNIPFTATNPITLNAYDGTSTTIYVRLKSGLVVNTYNGETISIAGGGATTIYETCTGSVTAPAPLITATGSLITFGAAQCINTASSEQSYTVAGSNLTANIVISPPTHYEISTGTGGSFVATSPINLAPSGGTVNSTTIYVRFKPTTTGAKTGNITHTSTGATDVNQATVSSTGVTVPTATATTAITVITATSASSGGNFAADGGSAITARGVCWNTATAPTLSNSFTSDGTGTGSYTSSITGLTANTTYYVRSYATNACGTTYGTSERSFTTLKLEPTNNATGFICGTTTATDITFTWTDAATGTQAPDKYLILCNTSGTFSDPVDGTAQADVAGSKANISQGIQTVTFTSLTPGTTYYFKVFPYTNATTNVNYKTNGTVLTGSCATTAVSACGTQTFSGGTTAPAGWTFTNIGGTYATQSCSGGTSLQMDASGDAVETATVTNPTDLSFNIKGNALNVPNTTSELLVQGWNGSSWVTIENITGTGLTNSCQAKTYSSGLSSYTKFKFTYTKGTGNLSFDDVSITCAGGPTITTTGTISAFGNVCTSTTTAEKTYTVSGTLLTDDIIITPPVGYEISKTSGSGFVANPTTLTLTQSGGNVATTTIYVRFAPTAAQAYNDVISNSSIGATDKNISVSGTGVSTLAPTVTIPTSASIGTTTATLGGNITITGCSNVTERGIYWSTTNGFADGDGTKVSVTAGPYSTGVFTQAVSGLTANTVYYYKAFATSADGTGYTSQGTFTTAKAEPTSQVTNFAVGTVTTSSIPLTWTAASPQPDKYLIKLNTAPTAVVDPVDGTDPADVTAITGGVANKETGTGAVTSATSFTGMTAGTMYNYKIYSLNNSGTSIDFLLTGAPSLNHATLPNPVTIASLTGTGTNTANISWTTASGYNNTNHSTVVFVKATSAVTQGTPTNAPSTYTANTVFNSGTAYQNDASAKCVYNGDGTSVSITGLSASTTYYVLIYTVVDASNSNSTNSYSSAVTANGTTSCANVTLPYSQGFNAATIPSCWSTQTVVGSSAIQYVASSSNPTTTPQEGTHYVYWNSYSITSGNETRLTSPPITTTGTSSVNVRFYWMNENNTSYTDPAEGVLVQYSTDGSTWDAGTFYSRHDASLAAGTSQWNLKTLTLAAGAGNQATIYVSFKFHSLFDDNCSLDNVIIEANVIKPEPTNHPTSFTTTCASSTSSTIPLTWVDASAGTVPDGYLIQWNTSGTFTDPVDGTAQANASGIQNVAQGVQAYTATGLTANTLYYFKIWPYTNSGSNINYKIGGTPLAANCTTPDGACLAESFEGTFPPTNWTNGGTTLSTSAGCDGTDRIVFNSSTDFIITPQLNFPSQITFQYKRSSDATAWSVDVQYSTTVGGTYTTISTVSGATTNCQTATVNLGGITGPSIYLKLKDSRSSGTNERYIDDVEVFCNATSCVVPTINATNLTYSAVTDGSMTLNFTPGDGSKRMIIAREGFAVNFTPADNTSYTANSSFSSAIDQGSGNKIVYSGSASSASISGLTGGATYYYKIVEFNCSNGMEQYLNTGALTGNQATLPSPVTSLSVTCQTGTDATISWTAPDGNYDGVIIGVRNSTNVCGTISDDANNYTALTAFGSGTSYGVSPFSFVVYKGTGTTVTVTGLTAGQPYQVKAYTYKGVTGSAWSTTPTTAIASLGVPDVTALGATPLNASVQVNWTNPSGSCWSEVMVVAKVSPAVNAIPTGDGTSYTADPVFGNGTLFDGGRVVYKGNSNSVTVTNLANGTNYCFKVYTRTGTSWSSGVSACATPLVGTTAYVPGSIAVLGVCSNMYPCGFGNQDGDDEITIVTFQEITPGTSFDMTDNGWERCINEKWGNAEGYMRIRRTGTTIPAGTIITFRLTQQSVGSHFTCLYPDNNWSVDIEEGSLILNKNGDQIYFMQGGTWNQGTAGNNDATYTGGELLFAFNTNSTWTRMICTASNVAAGTGRSQNSGLALNMECFNMVPGVATDYLKYVGDMSATTQRGWMERIKDGDNWNGFADCAAYYAGSPNYLTTNLITINSGGGGYTPGLWTGAQNQDWFYCGNWGNMLVPDKDVDVVLPPDATYAVANNCVIGAPPTGYTEASCKNFTNNMTSKEIQISNAASKLDIWGNYLNNALFNHSLGIVTFKGITAQTLGGTGASSFYNLTLNNSAGLTVNSDIAVRNSLSVTSGIITTGSKVIDLESTGSITEGASTTAPTSYVTGILKSTRNIGSGANQTFGGIGLEINESGAANSTVVYRTTGVTITAGLGTSIKRYFDITPTTNTGLTASMVFHYFDHEIIGFTEADLELYKSPDPYSTWYSQVGTISTGANTSSKSSIPSFSRWTLASKNAPLPVELLQFDAVCNGEEVDLFWTTASETNNDYFTIEKSVDLKSWNEVDNVKGAGNSNILSSYKYSDIYKETSTVYYRLKQTDYDGTIVTFEPVAVKCDQEYQAINVYPNPSTSNTICSVYAGYEYNATLEITNYYGAKVLIKDVNLIQGFNLLDFDVSGFQSGLYYVVLRNSVGKIVGYKQLIVQK